MGKQSKVRWAQRRLERWRAQYGGRGRPIPEHLWRIAVEVARAEGIEPTALALRVDRERLARRVALACEPASELGPSPSVSFVELEAHGLCVPAERAVLVSFRQRCVTRAPVHVVTVVRARRPGRWPSTGRSRSRAP